MLVDTAQPRRKARWSPTGRTAKTQEYYVSRPAISPQESYWGVVIDPDGNQRNRLCEAERRQYVEDQGEELDWLRNLNPGRILDIGAGPAWMLRELPDGWSKWAIEPNQQAVDTWPSDIARCYALTDQYTASFDVVICYHVIEHSEDPIQLIQDVRRVLKPGGWLLLGTPDFGSPCAVRFGDGYRMLHDKTHVSLFTNESMHRFLRDHAFMIERVAYPFPKRYANSSTMARWREGRGVSPPWPGNWMTFYCSR